ncbi:MAG TPA: hypothetical protein VFK04_08825 [Gemmatimonadaceae bacterium]|nr:hypothetical protein [Gemmatimonadaceae bacterium]
MLDGRIDAGEYGSLAVQIQTAAGDVRVWIARYRGFVYVAAELPDSTYYWGDDLVVSLDSDGSGGPGPSVGDQQWYLRRSVDSSMVRRVSRSTGRWTEPGKEAPRLGDRRSGSGWKIASESSGHGWAIELRVREASFKSGARAPRLALRTFNDQPQGWWSWPAPCDGLPEQRVEHVPDLWVPIAWR